MKNIFISKRCITLLLILVSSPILGGDRYFINSHPVNEKQYNDAVCLVYEYNAWLEQECMKNPRYKELKNEITPLLSRCLQYNNGNDYEKLNILNDQKKMIKDQLANSVQARKKNPNFFIVCCSYNGVNCGGSYNYTYDHSRDQVFMQHIKDMYKYSFTSKVFIAGSFIVMGVITVKIVYEIIKQLMQKKKKHNQSSQKLHKSFAQSV